jgi:hypothetical protein
LRDLSHFSTASPEKSKALKNGRHIQLLPEFCLRDAQRLHSFALSLSEVLDQIGGMTPDIARGFCDRHAPANLTALSQLRSDCLSLLGADRFDQPSTRIAWHASMHGKFADPFLRCFQGLPRSRIASSATMQ